MNISTVTEVIGVAVKKDGTEIRGSKNGKDWAMYTVILENGTKLNVFGPVKVGDTIYNLVQDEKYHSWSGQVKRAEFKTVDASQPTNAQIMDKLLQIEKLLTKSEPMSQNTFNREAILEGIDDEPISIDDIPF